MFESTRWELEEPETSDPEELRALQALTIVRAPSNVGELKNIPHQMTRPDDDAARMEIIQQYQFSSTLQRMSVIAREGKSAEFIAFTKGSPEMILSLSLPKTIPSDIMVSLKCFTEQGYRVIALACKDIHSQDGQVWHFHIFWVSGYFLHYWHWPTLSTVHKSFSFFGCIFSGASEKSSSYLNKLWRR